MAILSSIPDVDLTSGDIVAGLEPDEHVEIRRPLGSEERARVTKVRGLDFTCDGDAEAFLLGVETHRA